MPHLEQRMPSDVPYEELVRPRELKRLIQQAKRPFEPFGIEVQCGLVGDRVRLATRVSFALDSLVKEQFSPRDIPDLKGTIGQFNIVDVSRRGYVDSCPITLG